MTIITSTFTSKPRKWFLTKFADIYRHWYDQAWRHNTVCITTNWTVSHPTADVCVFATFLYYLWRTNYLGPMFNSTFLFTSKFRKWFSKLKFTATSMQCYEQALRHYIQTRQTDESPNHRLMCVYFHILYCILVNIHCISVPFYNTNQCRFSPKTRFSTCFFYSEIRYYMK